MLLWFVIYSFKYRYLRDFTRITTRLITLETPLKVRAAGFLAGVLLFSDLSFEKFSPGFYFFPKSKNSFAGSYFFLEFSHIVCCFLPFSVYLKAKTLKKIRLRRAGSYCFSKFSASGGVLLFSKIHKKNSPPGVLFFLRIPIRN